MTIIRTAETIAVRWTVAFTGQHCDVDKEMVMLIFDLYQCFFLFLKVQKSQQGPFANEHCISTYSVLVVMFGHVVKLSCICV